MKQLIDTRAIAWSKRASADGKVRLGAIVLLSALGLALFAIVMRPALIAAPIDAAPTWGKVLIAGGCCDSSGYLSSTELYDSATNSFAAAVDTAAMNSARVDATATLLTSGKVLIAGGFNGTSLLSSTELYDPATNSFAAAVDIAAMNTARWDATATPLTSGKVLIAGGCCDTSGNVLSSTELYDPVTNSFAAAVDTAAMNSARGFATATLLASGKVLIAGGMGPSITSNVVLSSTELYDPVTNSFAAAADTAAMNSAREQATATLLASGKVLIAGGISPVAGTSCPCGYLSSTELYDPVTNSFAAADTAAMNSARDWATATLLASGKVLIAGGYDTSGYLSSTDLYDPATNSFAAAVDTAAMNVAREHATATLLPSGKVLVAGGTRGPKGGITSSTEVYNPETNSFAAPADTASMNTARNYAVAILLPPATGPSPTPTATAPPTPTATPTPSGQVTLLPSTLDFGTIIVGQSSAPSGVTLTNGTAKKLTIRGTAIGLDFKVVVTTCSSVLNAGQSCDYFITFQPQSASTKKEKFRLTVRGSSALTVALQGVGTTHGTPTPTATPSATPTPSTTPTPTATPTSVISACNNAVLAESPAGFWPLSDSVGSDTAVDLTAGGNNGAVNTNGVTFGIAGGAVDGSTAASFTTPSGCIQINNQTINPAQPPVTIEFIMESAGSAIGIFDSAPQETDTIRNYNIGQVEWWNTNPQFVPPFASDSLWHYYDIEFFINGNGNREIDVYEDGRLLNSGTGTTDTTLAWRNPWTIGRINFTPTFNGSLQKFAVYAAKLNTTQITNHYNACMVSPTPSLSP